MTKMRFIGIDISGHSTRYALRDAGASQASQVYRQTTNCELAYSEFLARLLDPIKSEFKVTNIAAVGIAVSGKLQFTNNSAKLLVSRITPLVGANFIEQLSSDLQLPVFIENDAAAFTLAEAKIGAAANYNKVFGAILGSGVGGALVKNKQIQHSIEPNLSEWGHIQVEPQGKACHCGSSGCLKTIIAGPELEQYYHEISGHALTLKQIVARARTTQDQAAKATLERLISYFGLGIKEVVAKLRPEAIVIGGGLSAIDELYDSGRKMLALEKFTGDLVPSKLGEFAGALGASILAEMRA